MVTDSELVKLDNCLSKVMIPLFIFRGKDCIVLDLPFFADFQFHNGLWLFDTYQSWKWLTESFTKEDSWDIFNITLNC